ncbi:hypothetical protein QJS10_CPB15g00586 [Acorus calamus]|uniref:Uncharacterized protein n=1 Tax=Acorus calamus TaxID=4465 RepID=A0AAV9D511_ACOCL|nr:hypothetical protein QJS10_CPB15g00586 [Acorus calamus]
MMPQHPHIEPKPPQPLHHLLLSPAHHRPARRPARVKPTILPLRHKPRRPLRVELRVLRARVPFRPHRARHLKNHAQGPLRVLGGGGGPRDHLVPEREDSVGREKLDVGFKGVADDAVLVVVVTGEGDGGEALVRVGRGVHEVERARGVERTLAGGTADDLARGDAEGGGEGARGGVQGEVAHGVVDNERVAEGEGEVEAGLNIGGRGGPVGVGGGGGGDGLAWEMGTAAKKGWDGFGGSECELGE